MKKEFLWWGRSKYEKSKDHRGIIKTTILGINSKIGIVAEVDNQNLVKGIYKKNLVYGIQSPGYEDLSLESTRIGFPKDL